MGVFCQILINRPRRGYHKAGRPVTGVVRYTVDEPGLYKDIVLSLIGKGKVQWQERRGKHTYHYSGKELFTAQHFSIHGKGPENEFILPIGTFERPFTFVIPYNIPSSFKSSICNISYKIVIQFFRPGFFSVNKKFKTEIPVIGNIQPLTPEGLVVTALDKDLFTPFKKRKQHIHLQSEIPNTLLRAGENVLVNYKVTNDTDLIIPSLKAELVCRTIFTASCGKQKKKTKTIEECTIETSSVPDNAIANLSSIMRLADSLYTVQNSRIMTNEYRIKVTLRLPLPHINATLKIPVLIDHKFYAEDDMALSVPESEGYVEEPPSYFEAMNESNDKKEKD